MFIIIIIARQIILKKYQALVQETDCQPVVLVHIDFGHSGVVSRKQQTCLKQIHLHIDPLLEIIISNRTYVIVYTCM